MQNAITFTQTTLIQSEREFQSPSERERVPQSHDEGESEFLII